jgi:1-deoxy-D-xylulose-5-phosphate reductoisomerase
VDEHRGDEEQGQRRAKGEGVRIIGAEEAQAAIESGGVAQRRPEDAPRYGDVPEPPEGPRPALRFPLGDADPSEVPKPPPAGRGSSNLPHWTEPPSGEVPRILDEEEGDDYSAWSSLSSGPRWRDQPADWDDVDYDDDLLRSDEHRLGALDTQRAEHSDLFSFDEPDPEPVPPPTAQIRTRPRPPAADPYGAVAGRQPSGRDVQTAVITGLGVGAIALVCFRIGTGATAFLAGAVVVLAMAELYGALRQRGYAPATLLGLVATGCLMGAAYWKGETALPLVTALMVMFTMLWYLWGVVGARPLANATATIAGFAYVGLLGSFASLLLTHPDGIGLILGAVVGTVAYDVGGYFFGSQMGRTPIAPNVSPNKTLEGLVGGMGAAIVVCGLVMSRVHPWDGGSALALGFVVAVAAPLGDLCESMLKRDLGVKDMGSVLPGHGGLLDRFDALLFVLPSVYYVARLLEMAVGGEGGRTRSVGTQALDVVRAQPGDYHVVALAAARSVGLLAEQAAEFRPRVVALADKDGAPELERRVPPGTEVWAGPEALSAVARDAAVVLNAVVGFAGLPVTLAALEGGRRLALANKESLIAGGPVVQRVRATPGAELVPVDSEHAAVHQCLRAGPIERVARIVLTASGGPFRTYTREQLAAVTRDDALAHPTWDMGPKITVDSSTLMNKGLEVIEAHELFGVGYDRISIVVHPQSIVHSMVEFTDGATIAQLSSPDMRLPISYALGYPDRSPVAYGPVDLASAGRLDFEEPDLDRFPGIRLAYEAGRTGGTAPAWLNGANEVAVAAFLDGAIPWLAIAEVVEETLQAHDGTPATSADVVIDADRRARERAAQAVERRASAA